MSVSLRRILSVLLLATLVGCGPGSTTNTDGSDSGTNLNDGGSTLSDGGNEGLDAGTDAGTVLATCDDSLHNGVETGVDCGGGTCAACVNGEGCAAGTDCVSGVCDASGHTCVAASCADQVKNGAESDVDCGGSCGPCGNALGCAAGTDCVSGVCDPTGHTCTAASCADLVKNGTETDVDCGGSCGPCGNGDGCAVAPDCVSGVCDPTGHTCSVASCTDQVTNGTETDVDCGGSCGLCTQGQHCALPADCSSGVCDPSDSTCRVPMCTDLVKNGSETGVDCGGADCSPCAAGTGCLAGTDCQSGVCDGLSQTCSAAACNDLVKNGSETDVDCGGSCGPCGTGAACAVSGDCASAVCDPVAHTCSAASCTDQVTNGNETDVDCGGATCGACTDGQGCSAGADCSSRVCDPAAHTCSAAACTDLVQNGTETDVDCGGSCATLCSDGQGCVASSECSSGLCDQGVCVGPSCSDGAQNGSETGVDCGGSCAPCVSMKCEFTTASGGTADCAFTSPDQGTTGDDNVTLMTGQGGQIQLVASNVTYDSGTGVFSFSAQVQNLLAQSIGTIDGANLDASGVRLVVDRLQATGGTGAISLANADGTATFGSATEPYFQYDELLAPSASSNAKTVTLNVPSTVTAFTMSFSVSTTVQARLVINEVLSNPGGTISDANGEFFEVYNAGAFPVNMVGFRIGDSAASGDRPLVLITAANAPNGVNLRIDPAGYLTFGNTTNTTNNGGVPVDYAYGAALALANSLDALHIVSPAGYVSDTSPCNASNLPGTCVQTNYFEIDRVSYASAATSAQNGISRELKNPALDNSNMDGSNWGDASVTSVYGPGGRGTPKAQNSAFTP